MTFFTKLNGIRILITYIFALGFAYEGMLWVSYLFDVQELAFPWHAIMTAAGVLCAFSIQLFVYEPLIRREAYAAAEAQRRRTEAALLKTGRMPQPIRPTMSGDE